jgi:hypothetical protein
VAAKNQQRINMSWRKIINISISSNIIGNSGARSEWHQRRKSFSVENEKASAA